MSINEAAPARLCTQTGLMLSRSAGPNIFRVAKTKHGPFNPPARATGTPAAKLSRWDTPGRTIYGGSNEVGALIEVLSYVTADDQGLRTVTDMFDDVHSGDELFLHEQIAKELRAHGGMADRTVSRGWREDRNIYEFKLPPGGWFVDVTASDSVGALDEQLREDLRTAYGIGELNVSHMTADGATARAVTTHIADFIRGLVLDDGSLPHGIVYPSKYGTDLTNYAIWLRRSDDGTGPVMHPLEFVDNYPIHLHTKAYHAALKRLRLRTF